MKTIGYILVLGMALISCNSGGDNTLESVIDSGDIQAMRKKRQAIEEDLNAVNDKLTRLDAAIAERDTTKKYPLVNTFMVKDTLFNHFLEIQGNVQTDQNVIVYPEYSGVLTSILVKQGEKVAKGQALAKIDDGGLSSQVAQLQTQADLAKTTFERQKRLWDQKIGSEMQFLQAKANYESQQSAVAQMQSQLEKSTVRAPFSGFVDQIITDQGTVVAPGRNELFRVVNLSDMYIEAEVPESYVGDVRDGSTVSLNFPVLGETIESKVRETSKFISPTNRTFRIEVGVPNKDGKIKPNLTARLRINDYSSEDAILIPQSVISENADGEQYVYLAKKDTVANKKAKGDAVAYRSIIKTGKTQGDYVEVTEGIKAGDQIINEGARSVKEGQEVQILKD